MPPPASEPGEMPVEATSSGGVKEEGAGAESDAASEEGS
jgi:hypothetical protein